MSPGKDNKMKLLVLGGYGYLGNKIVLHALKKNWKVVSVSKKRNSRLLEHKNLKNLFFDMTNLKKLKLLSKYHFDYVVNVSGYVDHSLFCKNGIEIANNHLIVVLNLISILSRKKLKKFLQIGSSEEYGLKNRSLLETNRELPFTPYAASKVASTHFLQMLYRSELFPATIMRLFLVYGPDQKKNRIIPYVIQNCQKNKTFNISEGKQLRDFLYIDDAVDAIFLCLKSSKANGQIYNLGSGRGITIKVLVNTIKKIIVGGKPKFGNYKNLRQENKRLVAKVDKIQKDLKWKPKVNLENGLNRTILSYNDK